MTLLLSATVSKHEGMKEHEPSVPRCHPGLQSHQLCALKQDSLLLRLSPPPPNYKNPRACQGLLQDLSELGHEKVFINSELSHALHIHK